MNISYSETLLKLRSNNNIWNKFTASNEYKVNKQDKFDRILFDKQDYDLYKKPNVSAKLKSQGFNPEYPDDNNFVVALTHDIDNISMPFTHLPLTLLYFWKDLKLSVKNLLNKPTAYLNFIEIMEIEKTYGATSTFFIMATKSDVKRVRYDPYNFEEEICHITDNGFEVGLHTGFYSYDNIKKINEEIKILESITGKQILGCRNHYLRFKTPDTWKTLSSAGLKYDATFGFNNLIGFRNGMCHPFYPFDVTTNKFIPILEIPLNIMDAALFPFTNDFQQAWNESKKIIDQTIKYNGVLNILFHNDNFSCVYKKPFLKLYKKILTYCHQNKAWLTNCSSIYKWYEEKSFSN